MIAKPDKTPFRFDRRGSKHPWRSRPDLVKPATTPIPSGVRPDLAEAGEDGKGGVAGGVGKSI